MMRCGLRKLASFRLSTNRRDRTEEAHDEKDTVGLLSASSEYDRDRDNDDNGTTTTTATTRQQVARNNSMTSNNRSSGSGSTRRGSSSKTTRNSTNRLFRKRNHSRKTSANNNEGGGGVCGRSNIGFFEKQHPKDDSTEKDDNDGDDALTDPMRSFDSFAGDVAGGTAADWDADLFAAVPAEQQATPPFGDECNEEDCNEHHDEQVGTRNDDDENEEEEDDDGMLACARIPDHTSMTEAQTLWVSSSRYSSAKHLELNFDDLQPCVAGGHHHGQQETLVA